MATSGVQVKDDNVPSYLLQYGTHQGGRKAVPRSRSKFSHKHVPHQCPNESHWVWYYLHNCPGLSKMVSSEGLEIKIHSETGTFQNLWQNAVSKLDEMHRKSNNDELQKYPDSYASEAHHPTQQGSYERLPVNTTKRDDDSGIANSEQVVSLANDFPKVNRRPMTDPSFHMSTTDQHIGSPTFGYPKAESNNNPKLFGKAIPIY